MRQDECSDDADHDTTSTDLSHLHDRTPGDIERQILALSVNSTRDQICEGICAADWLLSRAREIDRMKKEIGIAWIDHNGEFDFGNIHYSVGYSLAVKCLDIPQTGHAVLKSVGGDFDQFLAVLVSQPFKHGCVRSVIGRPLHDQLFEARRVGRLINGVPERCLKRVDTRFLHHTDRADTP